MTVQPISPDPSAPPAAGRPDASVASPTGVITALVGALLLQFARVLEFGAGGLQSNWDSWVPVILPSLALPAALLWWSRSPLTATRLLPLIVGIALVPGAGLSLVPSVAGSVPDVIATVVVMLISAAIWSTSGLVLILAASVLGAGRRVAAGLAAALLVLGSLLISTMFSAIVELELPVWPYAVLVLAAAALLIVGGSTMPRSAERAPSSAASTVSSVLAALAVVVPSTVTYFVVFSDGPRSALGITAVVGVVLVLVAIGAAALLGREAVLLVLGAGLLLGCLYGLTSSVGAGLGRGWWLPLLVALALAIAAATSLARAAREIGMVAIGLTVIVLVSTFLAVESGDPGDALFIFLTVAGLVTGAIAGGCVIGASVLRLVRPDDLVPVLLLTLTFGAGVSRLLGWALAATDTSRNPSLLWISGVLLLAVLVTTLWPAVRQAGAFEAPGSRPGQDPTGGPGAGYGVSPSGAPQRGSTQPAPPAW